MKNERREEVKIIKVVIVLKKEHIHKIIKKKRTSLLTCRFTHIKPNYINHNEDQRNVSKMQYKTLIELRYPHTINQ